MPFTDIMMKLADGIKLSPLEREELRLLALDLDRNRIETGAWIGEGSSAVLRRPTISDPFFLTGPLQPIEVVKTTTKNTANDTDYYVEFDTLYGTSGYFQLDSADNTIIRVKYVGSNMCAVGHAIWAANATGHRAISGEYFDKDNVSLGSINWAKLPSVNGDTTVTPFAFADLLSTSPNIDYFKVKVRQNSGGPLDLTAFQMTLFNI